MKLSVPNLVSVKSKAVVTVCDIVNHAWSILVERDLTQMIRVEKLSRLDIFRSNNLVHIAAMLESDIDLDLIEKETTYQVGRILND